MACDSVRAAQPGDAAAIAAIYAPYVLTGTVSFEFDPPDAHQMRSRIESALIDTLRAQGFTQAIDVISLPNEGSIKAHEQVGFRRAGQLR